MIIWLNGAFGCGKTMTAREIQRLDGTFRVFDPEWVGYMLRNNLQDQGVDDFQDLPAWRRLVPVVAQELTDATGQHLVAVQTVPDQDYWTEITDGFEQQGQQVFHVLLDTDLRTLRTRIGNDTAEVGAAGWRMEHVDDYRDARTWLLDAVDLVIENTSLSPRNTALEVLRSVNLP